MEPVTFPVESSHVMLFARAVGDPNRIYRDDAYAAGTELGGVIAPPTFTEAVRQFRPRDPFRPEVGEPWVGSAGQPTGLPAGDAPSGGTTFHAEQHFTYHEPIRPGTVLAATFRDGEAWTKEGRRGGTLVFRERIAEFRDAGGTLYVTAREVSVETERPAR